MSDILKEFWCQEKLDFCRCDGTNEAHAELIEIMKAELVDEQGEERALNE